MRGKYEREESKSKQAERERETRVSGLCHRVTMVRTVVQYGWQVAKKCFCGDRGCEWESQVGENWTKV